MTTDVFCHIYPEEYLRELRERCRSLSFEYDSASGVVAIRNKTTGSFVGLFKKDSHFTTPELRIEHMNRYGIDRQILTVALPGLEPSLSGASPEDSVHIAKVANDAVTKICERFPEKFIGAAEIPVQLPGEAVDEIDRAISQLGLKSVQLYTQMGGVTLDSPDLFPVYERICRYDVPILLHPTNPLGLRKYERDFLLYIVWGWPYETTLALSRVALSGLLTKLPSLKFISHHLGGMLAFFAERNVGIYDEFVSATGFKTGSALIGQFKSMYHDTAVYGHLPALECGYSFFGPDHMLFATDYPFGPEYGLTFIRSTLDSIKKIRIPEDEKQKILELNAQKLFKL